MSLSRLTVHLAAEKGQERTYTGEELRPHFLYKTFGLKGTALLAFYGPCEVSTESLVDWEDAVAKDFIRARSMLHFIGEFFEWDLKTAVAFQRLAMSLVQDQLRLKLPENWRIERQGDDLRLWSPEDLSQSRMGKKLTVSIVTASPVSTLLHMGINVDASGAPVEAIGLQDLGLDWRILATDILEKLQLEYESIHWACAKVRPVF